MTQETHGILPSLTVQKPLNPGSLFPFHLSPVNGTYNRLYVALLANSYLILGGHARPC